MKSQALRHTQAKHTLFVLTMLMLTACDPFHGVMISYEFQGPLEYECVGSVLGDTQAVSNFSYSQEEIRSLFGSSEKHVFAYEVADSGSAANIMIYPERKGYISYYHSFGCIACMLPQELVDTYRPVMLEIEDNIVRDCGIQAVPQTLQESCTAVRCETQ